MSLTQLHKKKSNGVMSGARGGKESRKEEAENIHTLFPKSVPVILERVPNSVVPVVEKDKFLIPRCQTFREFERLVRRSLLLTPDMSLHLSVRENNLQNSSIKMGDLYEENCDEDGFLYICYFIDKLFDYDEQQGRMI